MFFKLVIRGINDNMLISIPIHIDNHEFDDIVIVVPITIMIINIIFAELLIIDN